MIYADNAATTRILDSVLEKMLPFLQEQYGNASSQYSLGVKSRRAIEQARKQVAEVIGAQPAEITFTSGGSETNSWVLQGIAKMYYGQDVHIITSSIEHHSIINACRALENENIRVTYLPVDKNGLISLNDVIASITPNTKLISIMLANNEIGTIQPIAEIGQYLYDKRILFHTDAVQAIGHIPVDINKLHVDFLSASAHKFNGAKGTGFLYKRSSVSLPQIIFGGKQEYDQRAGTENVAGIVAAGYAIEENAKDMQESAVRLQQMIDITVEKIREKIPDVWINGNVELRLPGTVNIGFNGVSGEALINILDLKGICVSTSSACNSGSDEPSHVLLALGLSEEQSKSAIRISYGKYNTIEEAKYLASAVCDAYSKIKSKL